jgi:hypothetical protein
MIISLQRMVLRLKRPVMPPTSGSRCNPRPPQRCCHDVSFTVVTFSLLSPFSLNPLANVGWAILELYVVRFAAPKKTDNLLIHEP